MTPQEKWLITHTSNKLILSELYRLLQKDNHSGKTKGPLRWERELGRALTLEEWDTMFIRAHKAILKEI